MSLFGDKTDRPKITNPIDPKWVRSPKGGFYQLLQLDTDEANLDGVGGVYIVWHGGVKPAWVYAGESPNLARAINEVADNEDVTQYEVNGKLYVSWSPVLEEYRRGVVLYLTQVLKTLVENPRAPKEESDTTYLIPVTTPGAKSE